MSQSTTTQSINSPGAYDPASIGRGVSPWLVGALIGAVLLVYLLKR